MRDRVSTQKLSNGALRYAVYNADGDFLRHEFIRIEDDACQLPTPLDKAHLLSDETAQILWTENVPENPTVDDGLHKLGQPPYSIGATLTTVRYLPENWLACDGSAFDTDEYAELYAALQSSVLPNISRSSDTTTYIKAKDGD